MESRSSPPVALSARDTMSRRVSLLLGICLFLLTGTFGSAHQSSLPQRDASTSIEQRLLRHRLDVGGPAVRPHPINAQSANDGVAQRVARARFERWFATQTGDRKKALDGMPD